MHSCVFSRMDTYGAKTLLMDKRQFALNPRDRRYVIKEKFGEEQVFTIESMLKDVENSSDQVLGAIVFLCREGDLKSVDRYIDMANSDEITLRTAANVKLERITGKLK